MKTISTDILVIGAGLAGIRAALAAKDTDQKAVVTIVSPSSAPHGSSFFNVHNSLGIQICHNQNEIEAFIEEAISIARPGEINPDLVRILATESQVVFKDLLNWGAQIKKDPNGYMLRAKGCFSLTQPRAYILLDMSVFYYKLHKQLKMQGVKFMPGWQVINLLTKWQKERTQITGAVLKQVGNGKNLQRINSKAIILSIGGRTSSYKTNLSGAGKASLPIHAWCENKSLPYINNDYTQYTWCRANDYSPWNISIMADHDACFRDVAGKTRKLPKKLRPLFEMRKTHAPVAYGMADREIDETLMNNLDSNDTIEVFHPDCGWEKVVLAAQASNGGIKIDKNGYTDLKGLYACGECAGGMHGANRLGGAMVLATQVFGKRAGIAAAKSIRR